MNKYLVTYYYLATGMEGQADTSVYGTYYANSKDEAKEQAISLKHPYMTESEQAFIRGCLTATCLND